MRRGNNKKLVITANSWLTFPRHCLLIMISLLFCELYAQTTRPFTKFGVDGAIAQMQLSEDESILLSVDVVGGNWHNALNVNLWDLNTGREIFRNSFPGTGRFSVSTDFGVLALSGYDFKDKQVAIIDPYSGSIQKIIDYCPAQDLVLSPDGKTLYTIDGSTIEVWDVSTGRKTSYISVREVYEPRLSITPDGKNLLYLASGELNVIALSDKKSRLLMQSTQLDLQSLCISQDSKLVLLTHNDQSNQLIDLDKGKTVNNFPGSAIFAGSKSCIYLMSNTLNSYDIATGKSRVISKVLEGFCTLFSSQDGSFLVSATGMHINDNQEISKLSAWDLRSGEQLFAGQSVSDRINCIIFSASRDTFFRGGEDGNITKHELGTGIQLGQMGGEKVRYGLLEVSPNEELGLVSQDDKLIIWRLNDGNLISSYAYEGASITAACFDPNSDAVIYALLYLQASDHPEYSYKHLPHTEVMRYDLESRKSVMLYETDEISIKHLYFQETRLFGLASKLLIENDEEWDLIQELDIESGKTLNTYRGQYRLSDSIHASPDGKIIASGGISGTLIWNRGQSKHRNNFSGYSRPINVVRVSPDGRRVVGLAETCNIWDMKSGLQIRDISMGTFVVANDFNYKGNLVVTGGLDFKLRVFEAEYGNLRHTLSGHNSFIQSVRCFPASDRVLSASSDGSIRLWDIDEGRQIAQYMFFSQDKWICMISEGYFNASNNGAQHLSVQVGKSVYSMDSFFETYYRPDIVRIKIADGDIGSLASKPFNPGLYPPPKVRMWFETASGCWTEAHLLDDRNWSGNIRVKVEVLDAGGGIREVRIYQNGKVVEFEQRGLVKQSQDKLSRIYTIKLMSGDNTIRALAYSDDLSESNPVNAVLHCAQASGSPPDLYIMAIGIDDYKNIRYKLNHSTDDSRGFVESIRSGAQRVFGSIEIVEIYNEHADKINVIAKLDELASKIGPDDVFILFYAGHGIALEESDKPEFFFVLRNVTQMSDISQCSQYGLSGIELREKLKIIQAKKQLLFIDACNSGAFAESFALRGAAEENALAKLSKATGISVYAATTSEQMASEHQKLGHGIFSYTLIEALSGKAVNLDGQISNYSLKSYLDFRVPQLSKQYRGTEQYPTTFSVGQEYPIALP